jgi:O-antigen/teichoic acid export membrane protein
MTTIKQKTINNMVWSVSERLSLQIVHTIISIVLARLLDPSEFGLIGMLVIFTSIAQSILDSGFGSALIQKKDATETDSSSIFYFNLAIGILLASILYFSAPLIAKFYEEPTLTALTRVLSLNLVINAFSLVQLSLLRKTMAFKKHFAVSISSVFISGFCGILAAVMGLGVWSLVIQTISHSLSRASLLWIINKWRPARRFSMVSLKSMFSFGSKLLIAGLIETIFKNIYQTFIGKNYSAEDLGFYSRATTMESAASVATSMALGQVIFPTFSPYQDDNETLRKVHSKMIKMSMFLHMPLMIGLIAIAEPLFLFLLTDKWADSIPYFQLLCVVGLLFPIVVQNYNLLRIKGRSDLHLRLEIVKYILTALAIFLTYKSGIRALLVGQISVAIVSHVVVSYFAGKLINYSLTDQFRALLPIATASSVMGLGMYYMGKLSIESNFIMFMLQITVGIIIYFLINTITRSPELAEYITIAGSFLKTMSLRIKSLLWKHR